MTDCVLKPWVQELTWKEQSAIMTAIRGSDEFENGYLRTLIRWLRREVFYDADVDGTFVKVNHPFPNKKELKSIFEYQTVHFASHLFHAFQILGWRHPDEQQKIKFFAYYVMFCEMLHMQPESEKQMEERLKDNREII